MKQIFRFFNCRIVASLLLFFIAFTVLGATMEKTVYVTVNSTFSIHPWNDIQSKTSGFTCASTGLVCSDVSAFSIGQYSKTETRYPGYSWGTYENGFYCNYAVEALKVGTYTITAYVDARKRVGTTYTDGDFTVIYHIVVEPRKTLTSITIPNSLELEVNDTYTFSPIIHENGAYAKLSWESSQPSVAKIDNYGNLEAISEGSTTIICRATNGVSAQCLVTVRNKYVPVESISLNASSISITEGETFTLSAEILPKNATVKNVLWTSSDETVAKTINGVVIGVKAGKCTVIASCENAVTTCKVIVNSPKYEVIYIIDDEVFYRTTLSAGETLELPSPPNKEGYTFSGWINAPKTMPAENIVIIGSFTVNQYLLTYKVDGEVYETETIEYGATITPIAAPTKEGHTFSGWSEIPATMPAKDVVIEGSFSINSYTVTYKVDGEVYKTETVEYGATIVPIAEPTKVGHTFSGWSEIPETMPANDIVIEGSFSINTYNITYKVNGEIYATDSIKFGATIVPIEAPTKEGHTFSGWSEIPETMPANDIVIEGTFSINSYTLTYKVDGEVYKTETIEYRATITPIAAPTKEGHTFSGWSEMPETMPANDVVIEGSFSINNYTITYKVDGEVYETVTVEYGATIEPIAEPTKEGHTFSGWSEIPETMPANDVVIEGTFSINSYTLTYKVDGEVYKTVTVAYGATIEPIAAPTKEGHTFSGWSEIPETMPANDVIIEGTFSINSYTLTYKVDGEVYKTETIEYRATITPIAAPTKEGHTFSGWSEMPETMPANDVVVEGSFSINNYTITYKVDSEVYETVTIEYGATITPIAAPSKEGHTFSGWSEIPATMPANDIVVEGSFSINSYTVTFMVDGEVYETMAVEYGAEIELPTPPEKEGYIFTAWIGVPATMPAEDIVIEGRFEVDTTGINAVILDLEKNEVYNLKGQRITESENLSRGIYIVNGKKVYIK